MAVDMTETDGRGNRPGGARKTSYAVSCSSAFRDAVAALADRRKVNVGDLARSIMLTLPAATIAAYPDPGEPEPDDRETIILKSGPHAGRPWRRKPRLQVRLPRGHRPEEVRRALAIALALDSGAIGVALHKPGRERDVRRLEGMLRALTFAPLPGGVTSRAAALYVLGFPSHARPDAAAVRARYRALAAIYHPDSGYGDHIRMSQLNQAAALLRRLDE